LKAEPSPRTVELHRRHPEIRHSPVEGSNASLVEDRIQLPEICVHQLDTVSKRLQGGVSHDKRRRIAIEPDESCGSRLEQPDAVTSCPDRAIDEEAAALGRKHVEHFTRQNRFVRHGSA
jgi:hypothetical protein